MTWQQKGDSFNVQMIGFGSGNQKPYFFPNKFPFFRTRVLVFGFKEFYNNIISKPLLLPQLEGL